jgi:hypothetical protein
MADIFNKANQPGSNHDEAFYEPGWNFMCLQFTSGASGAVPSGTRAAGFDSTPVVRDNAGLYTATLADKWTKFRGAKGSISLATGTYAADVAVNVEVFEVDLDAKTIKFATTRKDTGVAMDMASGDILTLGIEVGTYAPNTPGTAS